MIHSIHFKPISEYIDAVFNDFNKQDPSLIPQVNRLNLNLNAKNRLNKSLSFIEQDKNMPFVDLTYEERIYCHGLIATRKNNWHDFFNAIIWQKFPRTKSQINAIHHDEIKDQSSSLRSRKRDLLTLFDESGVIVQGENSLLEMIKNHQWQQLFIGNKDKWLKGEIKIITFGHAMFEKYLNPYIGMTAQALLLQPDQTSANLDNYLANSLNDELLQTQKQLFALPVLGIPQWHAKQDVHFYNNKDYFRPLKKIIV